MLFHEYGSRARPTVILLHGGGLSSWAMEPVARLLGGRYHVVTPIIEGHGAHGATPFVGIGHSAEQLLAYMDTHCGGHVFALGGLSLGGQIVLETLAKRPHAARFAILDGTLALPIWGVAGLASFTYALCYGLIRHRWFARLQARALFVPPAMFERYYADSLRMSRQSLVQISISNGQYELKNTVGQAMAKALILVGQRERGFMHRSARTLEAALPGSDMRIIPHMGHGELCLTQPEAYVENLVDFFEMERMA